VTRCIRASVNAYGNARMERVKGCSRRTVTDGARRFIIALDALDRTLTGWRTSSGCARRATGGSTLSQRPLAWQG
jgi:hypothetical protein